MSALDIVTNDFYTTDNVKRCSWCDYESGHANNCQQGLAQKELAALRARVEELEAAIAPIAKHRNWLDHEVMRIIDVYEKTALDNENQKESE